VISRFNTSLAGMRMAYGLCRQQRIDNKGDAVLWCRSKSCVPFFLVKDLTIRRDLSPPKTWLADLTFRAGFDVEHGMGVLTNGVEILGIGYLCDARRFKR
jgi:hypothetical protein